MEERLDDFGCDDAGFYSLGDMQDLVDGEGPRPSPASSAQAKSSPLDATQVAPAITQPEAVPPCEVTDYSSTPSPNLHAPRQASRHRKPASHGFSSFLLWFFMLGAGGLMGLRMLPLDQSTGRAVPELVSFVPWLLAPMAVTALLALLWRRRVLCAVSAAALATLLVWHAGFLVPNIPTASIAESSIRVMTLNCRGGAADASEIVSVVADQNVQVLALQEVSWDLLARLEDAGIHAYLPHSVYGELGSSDNGGMGPRNFS